jgi:hypothetical protein
MKTCDATDDPRGADHQHQCGVDMAPDHPGPHSCKFCRHLWA